MNTLGQRLKHARTQVGLSQQQLAALVASITNTKVGKSLVSQWESGRVAHPNSSNLHGVELATGFRARWILTGEGPTRLQSGVLSLDPHALERALKAVVPNVGNASLTARIITVVYEALTLDPTLNPATAAQLAAAMADRVPT